MRNLRWQVCKARVGSHCWIAYDPADPFILRMFSTWREAYDYAIGHAR